MKQKSSKKIICFLLIFTSCFLLSQERYSVKLDVFKSVFGGYQIEGEYFKTEKLSYGFGYTYIDTSLMLIGTPPVSSESDKGHSFSPFVRYYTNSNGENSSFYQANLRYTTIDLSGYREEPKENIISIDLSYGYQFRIWETIFFEPSIGLGAFYVIGGSDGIAGDFKPYPMLNMNVSLKL